MSTPSVLLLPGSIRRGSLHRKLAASLAAMLDRRGAAAELVDLGDYALPIYHGDDEVAHGVPPAAVALHDRLGGADGLIVLSPEHNGGPSSLLKNAIDWVTRVDRGVLQAPVVGLAATSPGSRGAMTGLAAMRAMFAHMRMRVVDGDLSIPHGGEAFETVDGAVVLARADDRARAADFVDRFLEATAAELPPAT